LTVPILSGGGGAAGMWFFDRDRAIGREGKVRSYRKRRDDKGGDQQIPVSVRALHITFRPHTTLGRVI
jgi:hypothetical protein